MDWNHWRWPIFLIPSFTFLRVQDKKIYSWLDNKCSTAKVGEYLFVFQRAAHTHIHTSYTNTTYIYRTIAILNEIKYIERKRMALLTNNDKEEEKKNNSERGRE